MKTSTTFIALLVNFLSVLAVTRIDYHGHTVAEFVAHEAKPQVQEQNKNIPKRDPKQLRYVTYNVDVFAVDPADKKNKLHLRQGWKKFHQQVMPALDADVLSFNEWPIFHKSSTPVGMVDVVEKAGYKLASFCGDSRWPSGNVVFVREGIPFEALDPIMMKQSDKSHRCIARVIVDFEGKKILTLTTHLDNRSTEFRQSQVKNVLALNHNDQDYVILSGDLNSRENDAEIKLIKGAGFEMAEVANDRPTYSHWNDDWIDYVFFKSKKEMATVFMDTFHTEVSDHLPVIADFSFDSKVVQSVQNKNKKNNNSSSAAAIQSVDILMISAFIASINYLLL